MEESDHEADKLFTGAGPHQHEGEEEEGNFLTGQSMGPLGGMPLTAATGKPGLKQEIKHQDEVDYHRVSFFFRQR